MSKIMKSGLVLLGLMVSVSVLAEEGIDVDQIHIDYINPFPANLEEILNQYEHIFVI